MKDLLDLIRIFNLFERLNVNQKYIRGDKMLAKPVNKRKIFLLTLLFIFIFSCPVKAGQQDNVNYIVKKIRTKLFNSLNSPKWKSDYKVVSMNIEDLRKTLEQGGKIPSNPVQEYFTLLEQMLQERRAEYKMYRDAQEKLRKNRKKAAKQAINDVGMEMISRLTSPKPGVLSPVTQASTKNAKVIKRDFARLKTIDEAIRTLEGYKKSILPSIRAIRDRKHALVPLVNQFASLTSSGFEGNYNGSYSYFDKNVGSYSGTIKFKISGNTVTGTLKGKSKNPPRKFKGRMLAREFNLKANFTGILDNKGVFQAKLKGQVTALKKMGMGDVQPFSEGVVKGKIKGGKVNGIWNPNPQYNKINIKWKATKQ